MRVRKKATGSPRVIGAIFFFVGLGMLVGAFFFGRKQLTILNTWPVAQAEVLSSEVTTHESSDNGSNTYGVLVEFRFTVDGREHTASSTRGYTTSFRGSMQRTADRFARGTRHPIHYNPHEPTDIRFNAGYSLEFFGIPAFLGGMGLLFAGVGFAVMRKKTHAHAVAAGALPGDTPSGGACPTCRTPAPAGEKFCPNCGTMLHDE